MVETIKVPSDLTREHKSAYLEHQVGLLMEDYFRRWIIRHAAGKSMSDPTWSYIPIGWSSIAYRYRLISRPLRKYLGLDSILYRRLNKVAALACAGRDRVFTVCQHADGVEFHRRVRVPGNMLVFSCGGTGHVPLPLLCDKRDHPATERTVLVSFQGAIETPKPYPARVAMAKEFCGRAGVVVVDTAGKGTGHPDYIELMARSVFCLCPRGFGRTSFRLMEAMHAGCVPVYIHSGDPWLPYQDIVRWSEFCVLVDYRSITGLYEYLGALSPRVVATMARRAKEVASRYFDLEFASQYVDSTLNRFCQLSKGEVESLAAQLRTQQEPDAFPIKRT